MPPKRKTPPLQGQSEPSKSSKKLRTVEELLTEFGDLKSIQFEPFQPEQERPARALLPSNFPSQPTPYDYFNLYFTSHLFDLISHNTNKYAELQRLHKEERLREWVQLVPAELHVFIGAIIYMGVHSEPNTALYWNTDPARGPIHTIPSYLSLRRFEQIKRYLHISCAETDMSKGMNDPNNKIWWYKVEPLASSLQATFQQYYSPSSSVSIDELMIRCFGRSSHTYKMPNKPIKQGYKVYGIADHGYIYSWVWSSKVFGIEDIPLYDDLTNTGALVRSLVATLPRTSITIYMDNYFTSVPLFQSLRACNYGAVGTTRPHSKFPEALAKLKKEGFKLEWNTLLAQVVDDTLCLAWQDNNIVLALSTIHTVHTANDFVARQRKRPAKTSTSARIVRIVFGDCPTKELLIPIFIDDYNHNMGGVDIANQLRESYETHKMTNRNWWPLFYWLIDATVINSYRLYQIHMTQLGQQSILSHVEFRTSLYCSLFNFSRSAKIHHLQLELGGERLFLNDIAHIHQKVKRTQQKPCVWCAYMIRFRRVLNEPAAQGQRASRSWFGCSFCNVALCQNTDCWSRYHRWDVN
jgi:hypothetical protein